MSQLVSQEQIEAYANYAEKNDIFEMFRDAVSKLVMAKPTDPYQFLIDYFAKPRGKAIVLFAPPGSGVSTAVDMLVKQYDFIHIKTATLLANEITNQTSTGIQAQPFVENGKLVPDQLITNLVFKALKENDVLEKGYVLEGYPRTKQQAIELLQAGFLPDHVLDIDLPDHKIIEYAASGLVDPVTNRLSEKRKSIVKTSSSSFLDRPPMDLGIVQRKLRDYRKFTQTFIGLFKSSYKRFNLSDGFEGQEQKLLLDIQNFLGTSAVTKAPRSFRIIVAGLPGSGKSTVAEKISSKFGAVLVSPKSVMLQAISAGNGQEFMPYLTNPHSAPPELVRDAIVQRLKQKDCLENGWILDGFPTRAKDAEYLEGKGIFANRLLWLDAPFSVCWERLSFRRYDPASSKVVNIKNLPSTLSPNAVNGWVHAPQDKDDVLEARFKEYEAVEKELKKVYGVRSPSNRTGILDYISSQGVGEENESMERVWEAVEGHLLRPIPASLQ